MQAARDSRAPGANDAGGRGLSTARAVLQVQGLLVRSPDGIRADEVAEAIGKSTSTAYKILASLVEEGVAVHAGGAYLLAPDFRELVVGAAVRAQARQELARSLDELFRRTHKRAYMAVIEGGRLQVVGTRGLQGMPVLAGVGPVIRESAHALALGKVALALTPEMRLQRFLNRGLEAFTPNTITDPDALVAELGAIRTGGVAVDRQEFDEEFCCLAAPAFDGRRRLLGILGIAMSPRSFGTEREELEAQLRAVAAPRRQRAEAAAGAFQECDESHQDLEASATSFVASKGQVSVPLTRRAGPLVRRVPARLAGPCGGEERRHGT
jgi:acetyl-CoA synthetase